MTATFDRQQITNWLTVTIVGVWIVMAVVRIWVEIPAAAILDAAMPLILGYWFASSAMKTNGDGGGKHALHEGVTA